MKKATLSTPAMPSRALYRQGILAAAVWSLRAGVFTGCDFQKLRKENAKTTNYVGGWVQGV
jgi:hypothetical protein